MRPERGLPMAAPARLRPYRLAAEVWRRAMRMYGELEGEIVTRLDQDLLEDYCLLMEQLVEMDQMRKGAAAIWHELERRAGELDGKQVQLRQELMKVLKDPEQTAQIEALETKIEKTSDAYLTVLGKAAEAFDTVVKLDSRVDRKRSLLHTMRQSLYLTPRARAGTAPAGKAEPEPMDDMDKLLASVDQFVNSGKQDGQ